MHVPEAASEPQGGVLHSPRVEASDSVSAKVRSGGLVAHFRGCARNSKFLSFTVQAQASSQGGDLTV